jgi:hypothetical protein
MRKVLEKDAKSTPMPDRLSRCFFLPGNVLSLALG